jgi:hypothetical protein
LNHFIPIKVISQNEVGRCFECSLSASPELFYLCRDKPYK